jgi:hypothetical protein
VKRHPCSGAPSAGVGGHKLPPPLIPSDGAEREVTHTGCDRWKDGADPCLDLGDGGDIFSSPGVLSWVPCVAQSHHSGGVGDKWPQVLSQPLHVLWVSVYLVLTFNLMN